MSHLKIDTELFYIPARTELVRSAGRNVIVQILWDVTLRRLVKRSWLASALRMEAVRSFETSVTVLPVYTA